MRHIECASLSVHTSADTACLSHAVMLMLMLMLMEVEGGVRVEGDAQPRAARYLMQRKLDFVYSAVVYPGGALRR